MRPQFNRWGPTHDYRGAHVLDFRGRLATITDVYRREMPAAWIARLRRFNGEDAGEHTLSTLRIIGREWDA
jgi:hypothetical protein